MNVGVCSVSGSLVHVSRRGEKRARSQDSSLSSTDAAHTKKAENPASAHDEPVLDPEARGWYRRSSFQRAGMLDRTTYP